MNLCSDGHDEVCYSERYCPCCIIIRDLDVAEATVKEQRSEISDLEDQIKDLKSQLQ
jgi:hypothetical protein